VAGMAACALSFRRFARGESTSTEPAPEILSSSLFIQREGFSLRDKDVTANHSRAGQLRRGGSSGKREKYLPLREDSPLSFPRGRANLEGRVRRALKIKSPLTISPIVGHGRSKWWCWSWKSAWILSSRQSRSSVLSPSADNRTTPGLTLFLLPMIVIEQRGTRRSGQTGTLLEPRKWWRPHSLSWPVQNGQERRRTDRSNHGSSPCP